MNVECKVFVLTKTSS